MTRTRERRRKRGAAVAPAPEDALVFGIHAVEAVLQRDPERIRQLLVQQGSDNPRLSQLIATATAAGLAPTMSERAALDALVDGPHQGVAAMCVPAMAASEAELEWRWASLGSAPLVLALDGVLDPRNLGACLRSADAAGVDVVLLPRNRRAPLSAVARKAASGAAETLFIVEVANLVRRLDWLREQDVRIIGAAGDTERLFTAADMTGPTALVIGGEARGLRPLTRSHCDELVAIPMRGAVPSLNVSVAAGIVLFEAVRQRHPR